MRLIKQLKQREKNIHTQRSVNRKYNAIDKTVKTKGKKHKHTMFCQQEYNVMITQLKQRENIHIQRSDQQEILCEWLNS